VDLNHPAGSAMASEVPIPEVHFARGAMLENMMINYKTFVERRKE